MKLNRIFQPINHLLENHRQRISIAIAIIGIGALILKSKGDEKNLSASQQQRPAALETYIPKGMTLIPIEIINLQQLQSIIDDRAVVDLFTPHRNAAVAESLKLVRSPVDPNIFAVLVAEEQSKQILQFGYQFIVVVKNRNSRQTTKPKAVKRQILFGDQI